MSVLTPEAAELVVPRQKTDPVRNRRWLMAPSVVPLLLWMIVPLVMAIYFSLIHANLLNTMVTGFAGIDNYRYLFGDPSFVPAMAWNEAFWSLNFSSANAAPLAVFIASYSSPEGFFWAKLSAASFLAVAPILVLGWLTQKQLVRGLTFGAVK
jgi:ABC-type sugar transport system permease subunit